MKKINYLFTIVITMLFLSLSCSKKGNVGPQGEAGVQGIAGPADANGKAGSVIYSGAIIPLSTTGATGDFYLNTVTGILYGPKAISGWGTGFSLAGSAGATGAAGSTGAAGATGATGATGTGGNAILTGSDIPDALLGKTGDFYLDISKYMLYGPKVASGWGPAVSLQGPAGMVNTEYSGWNRPTNSRDTIINNTYVSVQDVAAPALTQSIIDEGFINVYLKNRIFGIFALPFKTYDYNDYISIDFFLRKGKVIITHADNSSNAFYIQGISPDEQFRYVLIPGGKALAVKNHLDLGNYEAVRKFYRLKD